MTKKSGFVPLLLTTVLSIGACIAVIAAGWAPVLGLDLQGGVSVVLEPRATDGNGEVSAEDLEQTRQIIQRRIDKIGVAEPEVSIQGSNIVVELPGAKDQRAILEQVGRTAELRFRPVLSQPTSTPPKDAAEQIDALRAKLNIPEGVTADAIYRESVGLPTKEEEEAQAAAAAAAATSTTIPGAPGTETTVAPPTTAANGEGTGGGRKAPLQGTPTTAAPTTAAPATAAPAADPAAPAAVPATDPAAAPTNQYGVDITSDDFATLYQLEAAVADTATLTTPENDLAENEVFLLGTPDDDGVQLKYHLGPVLVTGRAIEDASATLQGGEWLVAPVFKAGADGIDLFNAAAAQCNAGTPICPALAQGSNNTSVGSLAVVLDGEVLSAPAIQSSSFSREQIQISGSFDEASAKSLADALKFGRLPVTLDPQTVQTVSATLGSGALRSGIIAGIIGLGIVVIYMIAYYRILGMITIGSLLVTAAMLWAVVGILGEQQGLALTLAGIVGIIVSIGVSLDSSIVYFENLKEDVAAGKNFRRSVEASFDQAWGTIVKADMSQLIGAAILYFLSVGAVKGFAFYLALTTLLDLLLAYLFIRPATLLAVRSKLGDRPQRFGIPVPPSVEDVKGGVSA